jgi:hypothetical protein
MEVASIIPMNNIKNVPVTKLPVLNYLKMYAIFNHIIGPGTFPSLHPPPVGLVVGEHSSVILLHL